MSSNIDYTSDEELRELYGGLEKDSLVNMLIDKYRESEKQVSKLPMHDVSFSLPTDDEIEKQADSALFGFGELKRKYDDDYYTGYQDGAKWIRDKRNES